MADLWPDDIVNTIDSKPPVVLLKEQAAILGTKTKNSVKAKIITLPAVIDDSSYLLSSLASVRAKNRIQSSFGCAFMLYAPALGDYTYRLFDISFGVDLYPARFIVDDEIGEEMGMNAASTIVARDESEFIEILSRILGSRKTRKVIQAIYSQSLEFGTDDGNASD